MSVVCTAVPWTLSMKKSGFAVTGPPLPQTQPPPWIQTWVMANQSLNIILALKRWWQDYDKAFQGVCDILMGFHHDRQWCILINCSSLKSWCAHRQVEAILTWHLKTPFSYSSSCIMRKCLSFAFFRAGKKNVKHPSLIPYLISIFTNTSSPPPKARRHAADKPPSCCWNCPKHLDFKQLNSEILSFWMRYMNFRLKLF